MDFFMINRLARLSNHIPQRHYINSEGDKVICRECGNEFYISYFSYEQERKFVDTVFNDSYRHLVERFHKSGFLEYMEKEGWTRKKVTIKND